MTKLLNEAVAEVRRLPAAEQDHIAALVFRLLHGPDEADLVEA